MVKSFAGVNKMPKRKLTDAETLLQDILPLIIQTRSARLKIKKARGRPRIALEDELANLMFEIEGTIETMVAA
jgi:hypothetical protein